MNDHITTTGLAPSENDSRTGSVTDLLKELRDEMTLLIRQEVALAKTEFSEKSARISRNVILAVAGALAAFVGVIFILNSVSALVGIGLIAAGLGEHAIWLAPLIVGVVVAIIGATFAATWPRGICRR